MLNKYKKNGFSSLDITIRTVIKPIAKNYNPVLFVLNRNWYEVMGEKYYKYCSPDKVIFQKDKKNCGTLYIISYNSSMSFYLENNKLYLMEKINGVFGYKLFQDIKIKETPKIIEDYCEKKVKKINKEIKEKYISKIDSNIDEELKEELDKLTEAILKY